MSEGLCYLLTDIATRCGIRDEKLLRKSKELIALLNSKHQVICSDTCKAVACLELASSFTSTPLNREEAIKYSGCKKKNYANIYNNISKLLNLDKVYSVREICLLVGVSDVQESVIQLLEKFKTYYDNDKNDYDFDHPMYPCAAVLAICRESKIKINQSKVLEISRVKRNELDELVMLFQHLIAKKATTKSQQKKNKSTKVKTLPKEEDTEITPRKKLASSGVMTDREYEEWKRKMLEE